MFNRLKFAQDAMMPPAADPSMAGMPPMDGMDMGATDPSQGQQEEQYTMGSLLSALEQNPTDTFAQLNQAVSPDATIQWTSSKGQPVQGKAEEVLKEENWNQMDDPQERGNFVGAIYKQLPQEMRADNMNSQDNTTLNVQPESAKIPQAVAESNAAVKKIAEQLASQTNKKASSFNLSKTAQRVQQQYLLYGPSSTRPEPTVNQMINEWHIVERNKGWGIKVQDFYGIDYEMVWRKHIMDKYHQTYQDADGNWLGGYIQKRFEVDKNIPELTNMQLKPGQIRKPARATLTEGQLEESRGSKPFNWVKAKSQGQVKLAEKHDEANTEFLEEQRKEKEGEGEGLSDKELLEMKHASEGPKKKVAYVPMGQQGQSDNQQASNPKAINTHWTCPQCNSNNSGTPQNGKPGNVCQCGYTNNPGANPPKPTVKGLPNLPGKKPRNYTLPQQSPTHITPGQQLNRSASALDPKLSHVPKDEKKDDDTDDDKDEDVDFDEEALFNDFKQLRSRPVGGDDMEFARAALAAKDRRERTFNALNGF